MELRRITESGLIIGGAMLFGASGSSGCLEPATSGNPGGSDIGAEIGTDGTAGDVGNPGDTGRDAATPDVRPDAPPTDTANCWQPPEPMDTLLGSPCRPEWEGKGLCRADTLMVKCAGGVWVRAEDPGDEFCWCDTVTECGPQDYICGAVGYVGIAKMRAKTASSSRRAVRFAA